MSLRLAPVILIVVCSVAFSQVRQPEDFLSARENVFRVYGSSSDPDVSRLYYEATEKVKTTRTAGLLYRQAAFAELAGLYGEQEKSLLGLLVTDRPDATVAMFCIEVMRARGTLTTHIASALSAVDKLDAKTRIPAMASVARAYMWSKPPDKVISAVRKTVRGEIDATEVIPFAAALASWGYRDEAAEILRKKATAETQADALVALVRALNQIGARGEARRAAEDFYSRGLPPEAAPGATLQELEVEREDGFALPLAIAVEGAALDKLIGRVAVRGRGPESALVDYAVVLAGAGRSAQRAEVLRRLYELRRDTDAAALYGSALIDAGDAYSTQNTLLASLLTSPSVDDDPYMDLFDAVAVLRDPQAFLQSATLLSGLNNEPQVARTMSEYARILGAFGLADRLFASFVVASGLGPDTRFNWEGSRLLAAYYLDTGRLGDAKSVAMRAIEQLLDVQGPRKMTRSTQPERFVALFDRFGEVSRMLEYCLTREKDLPDSTLLLLVEQEAYEHLGHWSEAWKVLARLNEKELPAMRDVFLADSKARAGRLDEAIKLYEKAVAADSRVPARTRRDLLDLYAKTQRWDDAEKLITGGALDVSAGSWVFLGSFFDDAGQVGRAAHAYERLDDRTIGVEPRQLGDAVRFFAGHDPAKATRLLEGRLALQTSFWLKYGYLDECLPESAGTCPGYLAIGAMLEKGRLGSDHALLGLFYRLVSVRAARIRDYHTALAAAKAACMHEPHTIENAQQLANLVAGVDPSEAEGVAGSIHAVLPVPSALLQLAAAQLGLGRNSEANHRLEELAAAPLSSAEAHDLVAILGKYPVGAEVLAKVRESITSAWSWTLRARLADAALVQGDTGSAVNEGKFVVNGGTYVGRSLWAADFYTRAGDPGQAGAVIELFKAASNDHPALIIAQADIARSRGDLAGTAEAISSARKRTLRPQFSALFGMEIARVSALQSGDRK